MITIGLFTCLRIIKLEWMWLWGWNFLHNQKGIRCGRKTCIALFIAYVTMFAECGCVIMSTMATVRKDVG